LSCFQNFVNYAENFLPFKISILHTDRGGEYNSDDFKSYTTSTGISVEQAPADTPQQNGVAERFNRTLTEKVRAIMSAASLPKWLWGEIVSTASLLINIAPCSVLKSDTPHNVWMKASDPTEAHHRFDYKQLKVIGCRAYTYIKKEHRDKLSPKAKDLVMVGYDAISKAYRLLDSGSKKIVVSQNVVCNEQLFPYVQNTQKDEPGFEFSVSNAFFQNSSKTNNAAQSSTDGNGCVTGEGSNERENQQNNDSDYKDCRSNQEQDQDATNTTPNIQDPSQITNVPIAFSQPTRTCGRPQFYGNPVAHLSNTNTDEPTYRQAMASPERQQWLDAMQEEYNSLTQHNVGQLVDLPNGAHEIGGMWRLKIKQDQFGEIIK
jgi:hypothetical protein